MTLELLSMLGGGVAGFLMRFLAAQSEAQSAALKRMIDAQSAADDSADRAAARSGGVWIRRAIVAAILFAVVIAPFILSFLEVPVVVETDGPWWDILDVFGGWETVQGFILLPEVRQGMLAILGFYFGSSQVKA
tara:strand:+ start:327 stop:728 length:402 start_codon:yes stop_codon:yes gene_type:complete